jgi:hypothetical protein
MMRNLKRPDDAENDTLFDTEACAWWHTQLAPGVFRRLDSGVEGMIRRSVLRLLPAEELAKSFSETFGRPTKELFAIVGLLLMAEFYDWTVDETADAWSLHAGTQFALGLPRDRQSLCPRTVDNYRRLLRESGVAQEVFETVTASLLRELGVEIKKQRLDSTHVLSNMAKFGRLRLLATTVKRFLVQLKKRHLAEFEALPEVLRERYFAAESRLFGSGTKHAQDYQESIQQAGEDIGELIARLSENEALNHWPSYLMLERVFREQCEITTAGELKISTKAEDQNGQASQVLQNPSDPDAGFSGHKGAGYQVQLSQTHDHGEKAPGMIVGCIVENAGQSDAEAVEKIAQQQERMGTLPKELLADTAYGSQANVEASAARGVDLISPAAGAKKAKVAEDGGDALDRRRAKEETEEWKKKYAPRSGMEGVNTALKNTTGMRRLRVRGDEAMGLGIYFKVTGWNIRTAVQIVRSRARKAAKSGATGRVLGQNGKNTRTRYRPRRRKSVRVGKNAETKGGRDFLEISGRWVILPKINFALASCKQQCQPKAPLGD